MLPRCRVLLNRPVQCRTSYAGAVDRHVQLNIRIARMDKIDDIADCIERNIGSMNVVNMVTCMHRAAKHSNQDGKKATGEFTPLTPVDEES